MQILMDHVQKHAPAPVAVRRDAACRPSSTGHPLLPREGPDNRPADGARAGSTACARCRWRERWTEERARHWWLANGSSPRATPPDRSTDGVRSAGPGPGRGPPVNASRRRPRPPGRDELAPPSSRLALERLLHRRRLRQGPGPGRPRRLPAVLDEVLDQPERLARSWRAPRRDRTSGRDCPPSRRARRASPSGEDLAQVARRKALAFAPLREPFVEPSRRAVVREPRGSSRGRARAPGRPRAPA